MHPKELSIKDYTYNLPPERIAHYPLTERDNSKLLIYKEGQINEDIYRNIAQHISQNSIVVFNNTRVIQARLFFTTATGAKVEIFCLEPALDKYEMATVMSQTKSIKWKCMVGRASKWKEKILELKTEAFTLNAELVDRTAEVFIVEFKWQPEHLSFAEVLDKAGVMPIPPYLTRQSEEIDATRYQTIYAKQEGSVAAPTAGLHFTESVMAELEKKNIQREYVTLHVGAGTFKPVKSATMQDHEMHAEWIDVSATTISSILNSLQRDIIAVGTTSLRTLETLYWMGVKAKLLPDSSIDLLEIKQWDAYELYGSISAKESLETLLLWMQKNGEERLISKTQIIIAPGYSLRIADGLVTNFHQPDSTLLLLVAAVVGDKWRAIYDYAMENQFRFLSYGDGSLLYPVKKRSK